MTLFEFVTKEYFSIIDFLLKKDIPVIDNKITINSALFYTLLDKNLYIKRQEKLRVYRQLNLITCNSNGFSCVVYDKETKKSQRKIVINLASYKTLKSLICTTIK